MSDTELLDILEAELKEDPLVLWYGDGEFPGRKSGLRGLSLISGSRTLRQAIAALRTANAIPKADPDTTESKNLKDAASS